MNAIESAYISLGKSYIFVTSVLADRLPRNPGKPGPNTASNFSVCGSYMKKCCTRTHEGQKSQKITPFLLVCGSI